MLASDVVAVSFSLRSKVAGLIHITKHVKKYYKKIYIYIYRVLVRVEKSGIGTRVSGLRFWDLGVCGVSGV